LIAYEMIKKCYSEGNTLFICGNGGSAADSEHLVAELMKGFILPRKITDTKLLSKFELLYGEDGKTLVNSLQNGLRAISLMSHPSLNSAYSNDVNPEMVFAQQLFVLAKPGDILIGISTSGNSKNVRRAIQLANVIGVETILLTGINGGKCEMLSKCVIKAPSHETFIIQEYHLPIYHTLALMLEEYFYGSK
ncbi:MAG: SIS domain-containing protein, partial [Lentisphaerota bacterium]